jgi:membrane protein DedA with SNARE-associated domain
VEHLVVSEVGRHGYLAVFVLMVLESACIPIPSEAVMLFGGALAGGLTVAGVHLHLDVVAVALAGTAGNLLGSWIAYAVGRIGGRPLVERFGRYVLLRPHDLDRAERFFARRGSVAVLVARVLPVVRTFISLPAGAAEMPVARFSILTLVGSLPWTFALALAGDALASNWSGVSNAFTPVSIAVGALIVAWIAWWVVRRMRSRTLPEAPERVGDRVEPVD